MANAEHEFGPGGDVLQIVCDFDELSRSLQQAIDALRRQPDCGLAVPNIERALEKARTGAELARRLADRLQRGD